MDTVTIHNTHLTLILATFQPRTHLGADPGMTRLSIQSLRLVYLVLTLGKEAAAQAVVGCIVWAFRRPKKPRSREMSVRGYALHRVCPQLSSFSFHISASNGTKEFRYREKKRYIDDKENYPTYAISKRGYGISP